MNRGDKLLLKNGYDLKGNKTGKRVEILSKRQKAKKRSKPYIKNRKHSELSLNEKLIADLLTVNRVRFEREYYMRSCHTKSGYLLFFDFYLPNYNAVIEYDGIHHFKPIYGQARFEQQKQNDGIKNQFCKHRNIPLLRISCFDKEDIETIICKWFDKNF